MDFYQIRVRETREELELYPDWTIGRSEDLMVQGRMFYAIYDRETGLWSRDEYEVQRLVDEDMRKEAERLHERTGVRYSVRYLRSFGSTAWVQFRKFVAHISDNSHPLDTRLIFANTEVRKDDFASKRLPYAIGPGDTSAWDELISILYSPDERAKIEWAIGSIVSGDSKRIQKFFVFYGPPGTGKSTVLNIIQALFEGYTTTFDGKALGSSNASFATEVFKHNPLVAIQHDGDLSRLEDNARLNSIIAHEEMTMNEKYKSSYTSRVDAMLFIGSNQPVRISDAKSGIIRRLVDVHPSGVQIPVRHYHTLISQVTFELGAIAHHCLQVYRRMGKNYYNGYRPLEMILQTDVFFNFIEAHYDVFSSQDSTTLRQAYALYKEFCVESGIERPMAMYKMREELRNYFNHFRDRDEVDGRVVRSYYSGFNADKFKAPVREITTFSLVLDETRSLLDEVLKEQPAQLAKADGTPARPWDRVKTRLLDIDSSRVHFLKPPKKHIIIDFDLRGPDGIKNLERNLEAASSWPATYAELSKSGGGVHLHYIYDGDTAKLASQFAPGIEVKVYRGDASLRRRLSRCNAVPVSTISSGLPIREERPILTAKTIQSERGLRDLIQRNLRKEIHAGTKPSIDFIAKILEDAHESGIPYDVTDMRSRIIAFANNSSNQAPVALKVVRDMKFAAEVEVVSEQEAEQSAEDRVTFFDVEVYPNLFVICWQYRGDDNVVRMINPRAQDVEALLKMRLVGFYNRRYDNHILYAAAMGWSNERLFALSTAIIDGNRNAPFAMAYGLSYADIWDFSSIKASLKKFEIMLGVHHMELDIPWDQPVDERDWPRVVEYCANDVRATAAVFEDRWGDFVARQILAELSGLTVNDTTAKHTAKIIFGDDRRAREKFVYTDLSREFPGYRYDFGKSSYRGEDPGEGGYVYAEPGIYSNVALLDVASMHPTTIEILNLFGPYTDNFAQLRAARMAIKRKDFAAAREMLDGRLAPYLKDEEVAEQLSYALKIVINIVYGLTSAKFDNPFRDLRNIDNIVAKRGALFMIDLKKELQNGRGDVVHIKTDSIKIPNGYDEELLRFIVDFGKKYGYEFDHEATYEKFCLVNDAVYIAYYYAMDPRDARVLVRQWVAVGAQFQHPYVFKTLFTREDVVFEDLCENRTVSKGTMYLDTEGLPRDQLDYTRMRHLGKTGRFVPVRDGGGTLYRVYEDKYYAVAGTKGYRWMDAEVAKIHPNLEVDMRHFESLAIDAIDTIDRFGKFEEFIA